MRCFCKNDLSVNVDPMDFSEIFFCKDFTCTYYNKVLIYIHPIKNEFVFNVNMPTVDTYGFILNINWEISPLDIEIDIPIVEKIRKMYSMNEVRDFYNSYAIFR